MKSNKLLSLIGLAMKAGKIASGEFTTEKEIKSGKARLVIAAEDASENTQKKFRNMCTFYQVPFYVYGTKEQLGAAIGKEYRAMVAVLDDGFAKGVTKHLREMTP